jgi:hypothetical protein
MPGNETLHFSFIPYSLVFSEGCQAGYPAAWEEAGHRLTCELCEVPLAGEPPVLLESGKCLHLECYLKLQRASDEQMSGQDPITET